MKTSTYFLLSFCFLFTACGSKIKKVYYKNGSIKIESFIGNNGLKQGIEKEYYENGNLKSECYYVNDTIEGFYKDYHENGHVSSITTFKKGLQHGTIMTYSENGKLLQHRNYFLGKKNGLGYLFYNNGKIQSIGLSKNDKTQFKIEYDSLGNITKEQHLIILDILNKPTIKDSIKIKANVIGFYDGGKINVYAFIQKNLEGREGIVPKMKFNPNDSCYYYSFPPEKVSGKYYILVDLTIDHKFQQMTDTVFSIE